MPAQPFRLNSDVLFLTELRPFRNYQNLDSLARAASHIRNMMLDTGLEVSDQQWMADDLEYTNVIGVYNPGKPHHRHSIRYDQFLVLRLSIRHGE
jgi:hypothetical protein